MKTDEEKTTHKQKDNHDIECEQTRHKRVGKIEGAKKIQLNVKKYETDKIKYKCRQKD